LDSTNDILTVKHATVIPKVLSWEVVSQSQPARPEKPTMAKQSQRFWKSLAL